MADIDADIAAYTKLLPLLEAKSMGKWVVIANEQLAGIFDSFDQAAQNATGRFGRGPFLIRQIGSQPVTLPASVMFRPVYA